MEKIDITDFRTGLSNEPTSKPQHETECGSSNTSFKDFQTVQVQTVQCPICLESYPLDDVQTHADTCLASPNRRIWTLVGQRAGRYGPAYGRAQKQQAEGKQFVTLITR